MSFGRPGHLAATLAFAASVVAVSFHLATEEHAFPFSADHHGHEHNPKHPPHPSADHAVEAASTPRPILLAVVIDLAAFELVIPVPETSRFARPADDRSPPDRPPARPASARAPPA